jgi:hypothetical protein
MNHEEEASGSSGAATRGTVRRVPESDPPASFDQPTQHSRPTYSSTIVFNEDIIDHRVNEVPEGVAAFTVDNTNRVGESVIASGAAGSDSSATQRRMIENAALEGDPEIPLSSSAIVGKELSEGVVRVARPTTNIGMIGIGPSSNVPSSTNSMGMIGIGPSSNVPPRTTNMGMIGTGSSSNVPSSTNSMGMIGIGPSINISPRATNMGTLGIGPSIDVQSPGVKERG